MTGIVVDVGKLYISLVSLIFFSFSSFQFFILIYCQVMNSWNHQGLASVARVGEVPTSKNDSIYPDKKEKSYLFV